MSTNSESISEFTALTTIATGDLLPVVDVSDTTDSAEGTTKQITVGNLFGSREVLAPDTVALSAAQCQGTLIHNFGMADADAIITLPAAAKGLSFICILTAARAKYYRLTCLNAADDKIYLDGTAGSDDGYVGVAAAVIGNCIQLFTFPTSATAYDWYACTVSGSWLAG